MTRPDRPWEPALRLAVDVHRGGDTATACDVLRDALARHPDVAPLHAYLAGYLHLLDDHDDAVPHARRAVELAPRNPIPSRTLVLVLLDLERAAEALAEAERFRPHARDTELAEKWDALIAAARAALTDAPP